MRKLIGVGVLLLICAAEVPAQQVCDFDITATGSDRWQVWHADTLVSEHTQYYQAVEIATRAETASPSDSTEIKHDAVHRVECPEPDVLTLDSLDIYPDEITVQVGETSQLTAVAFSDDSLVACSGACDTIPGWGTDTEQVLTFHQLAWLGQRIPRR